MAKTDFVESNILLAIMADDEEEAIRLIRLMSTNERRFLMDVAEEMIYFLRHTPNPLEVE